MKVERMMVWDACLSLQASCSLPFKGEWRWVKEIYEEINSWARAFGWIDRSLPHQANGSIVSVWLIWFDMKMEECDLSCECKIVPYTWTSCELVCPMLSTVLNNLSLFFCSHSPVLCRYLITFLVFDHWAWLDGRGPSHHVRPTL